MSAFELIEFGLAGAEAAGGFFDASGGEFEVVEEDFGKLDWTVDIEGFVGEFEDFLLGFCEVSCEAFAHFSEEFWVDFDAAALHAEEDRDERKVKIVGDGFEVLVLFEFGDLSVEKLTNRGEN